MFLLLHMTQQAVELPPPLRPRAELQVGAALESDALYEACPEHPCFSSWDDAAARRATRPSCGRSRSAWTTRRSGTWCTVSLARLRSHDSRQRLQVAVAHLRPLQAPSLRGNCALGCCWVSQRAHGVLPRLSRPRPLVLRGRRSAGPVGAAAGAGWRGFRGACQQRSPGAPLAEGGGAGRPPGAAALAAARQPGRAGQGAPPWAVVEGRPVLRAPFLTAGGGQRSPAQRRAGPAHRPLAQPGRRRRRGRHPPSLPGGC